MILMGVPGWVGWLRRLPLRPTRSPPGNRSNFDTRPPVASRAAPDEGQPRIGGRLHDRLPGRVAGEEVGEAGFTGAVDQAMQRAAPDVAVHEKRTVPGVRKRQGQIRRYERLPVPRPRTRDRKEQGAGGAIRVQDVEADPP